jgi:pilus assembly protein Flp/PilA
MKMWDHTTRIRQKTDQATGPVPKPGQWQGQRTMMKAIIARLRKFRKNEEGVTAMEYGLIAAATVVAIATLLPGIGSRLSAIFSGVSSAL